MQAPTTRPTYHREYEPELLDELRDRLVGVAAATGTTWNDAQRFEIGGSRIEIPEGAIDWWVRQAASVADDVLPRLVAMIEDGMAQRLALRGRSA